MTDTLDKPPDIVSQLDKQQLTLSDDLPPLNILRQMIQYETALRLSEPVQELFDLYHNDDNAIT